MGSTKWFEVWQNLRTGETAVTARGQWAYQRKEYWQIIQAYRTEEAAMNLKRMLEVQWDAWDELGI